MERAGFSNVQVRTIGLPIGSWGGHIGKMVATDLNTINEATRPLYMRDGMSAEEFDDLMRKMRQEWEDYRSHWIFHIAYGQRAR